MMTSAEMASNLRIICEISNLCAVLDASSRSASITTRRITFFLESGE